MSLSVVRRQLLFACSIACIVAVWMMPLSAQGAPAPAPVVSFVDSVEWIITYLFCPAAALYLVVSALWSAAEGHHGAGGSAAVKVGCAVCLIGITVVMNWLKF